MSNFGKVQPGQPWKPPRADQQNAWDQVADFFETKQQLSIPQAQSFFPRPTDLIRVKNNSGADRARGDVLELDTFLLDSLAAESIWFSGIVPTGDRNPYCVLLKPIKSGEIGQGQISGVCIAKLNNSTPADTFAHARTGQTQIETVSCGDGNAHIFHREEIDSQWWAVVRLSNPNCNCDYIRFKIVTADPTAKTAVVAIQTRPVGCESVPDEIADGSTRCDITQPTSYGPIVTVCDPAGCFLNESAAELACRDGGAKYVLPIYTNTCQPTEDDLAPHWEIIWLCCPSCD